MAGGFLLIGALAAALSRLSPDEAAQAFVRGAEELVVAALVVGFARAIQVVLVDGQIMDTIIYGAASLLQQFPRYVAAEGMLVFQSLLNFFIPSGSGQAAATMPLMAPLARVPYGRWLRFVLPLFVQLCALAALFLAVAVWMDYS